MKLVTQVSLSLPNWLFNDIASGNVPTVLLTEPEQMAYAIHLSRRNVEEKAGGPFGAVVVETQTGIVKGVGVNSVVPMHCSLAHAEAMALTMAQAAIGTYDLGEAGSPKHTLATSTDPCVQCFGMVHWSGVTKVLCGAYGYDAERLARFNEGPKHPFWVRELKRNGVAVKRGLLRKEACAVLRQYRQADGIKYNGRGEGRSTK